MTRIRANCPSCGEVDLRPNDIRLCVVGTDEDDVREGSTYRFECPDCREHVAKPADSRIARLLLSGGVDASFTGDPEVEAEVARACAALDHPEGIVVGPPLTSDDLLDFHLLLETDHWFDDLVSRT